MDMTTVNISLPQTLKQYIEEKVAGGRYSSASEFVRELLRDSQERESRNRLETLIREGLESGPPSPMTNEDWEDVHREVGTDSKKGG